MKTVVEQGDKIRPNKSNTRIVSIRKRLNELGFLNDTLVNTSEVLDTLLQESVKNFQEYKQLKTDAIIGKGTIKTNPNASLYHPFFEVTSVSDIQYHYILLLRIFVDILS